MKFSHVPGGMRQDCNSPHEAPLAEDCWTCSYLADSADRNVACHDPHPSTSHRKGRIIADAAFLMVRASLLASVPAAVTSKERP